MHAKPVEVRFDRHFWMSVVVGLPVVAAAVFGLACLGWWSQGAPSGFGPGHWLSEPLMLAGFSVIGGIVGFFAVGLALVLGWPAYIVGSGILGNGPTKSRRQ
ncbi:hypothetical protein DVT68_10655 [Dyella solisilvae]|uniref:Uncharacterized protein n=1 Tax=Dyella solisilvae TaxID=1920168 RepID=A0A370K926_9GAMM|nr:hypothetical protein [Dyella solisilvae]RDI98947.1 hypothetical protein DVT68_10655 [Dyella solisilvae]